MRIKKFWEEPTWPTFLYILLSLDTSKYYKVTIIQSDSKVPVQCGLKESYHYRGTYHPYLYPKDRSNMFLHNTGNNLHDHMASQPRQPPLTSRTIPLQLLFFYIKEMEIKMGLNQEIFSHTILRLADNNYFYSKVYLDRTRIYVFREFRKDKS